MKPYILPMETVSFVISASGPEETTLHLDFADGTNKILTGGSNVVSSHWWQEEGTYVVNITAVSRTIIKSHFETINITYVEEGRPPEKVHIKPETRYDVAETGHVEIYLDAFSPKEKNCLVQLSPDDVTSYDGITDLIFSKDIRKIYPTIGMYNVSFQCSNDFGSTGDWHIAVSANPELQFEHHSRPIDIEIPVYGAGHPANNLEVYIDDRDETSSIRKLDDSVIIEDEVIKYSGEHLITLKSSGKTVLKKIFNIQEEVRDVTIVAPIIHTEIENDLEFTFRIGQGDFIHVELNYGDSSGDLLFVAAGDRPVTMQRNHSYSELGKYYVSIRVANDVSATDFRILISIERPLVSASMHGSNITTLGVATPFIFKVDMHMSPAMPVSVTFDYDNGIKETVMLGLQKDTTSELIHNYVYPDYGIYRVKAIVSNNISKLETFTLVQVGENITTVDTYADADKGMIGDVFTFTIDCPRGSPIYVEMEMGDGEFVNATRGVRRLDDSEPREMLTEEPRGTRKKRNALESDVADGTAASPTDASDTKKTEQDDTEPTHISATQAGHNIENTMGDVTEPKPTLPPNEAFILTYAYKTAGTYSVKVKVHNRFSRTETYLCPEIVIASKLQSECDKFEVAIDKENSQDNPLVNWRSKEVNISTTASIACGQDWLLRYTPRYSWKTQWKTQGGQWRPELDVCETEMPESALTIPGNTLWYGTYRLSVTMTLRTIHMASRRKRSMFISNDTESDSTFEDSDPTVNYDTLRIESHDATVEKVKPTEESPKPTFKKRVYVDPYEEILKLHKIREDERQLVIEELSATRGTTLLSETKTTYLKIVKSPLVADIKDWSVDIVTNFVKSDVIKANISVAHDPDVPLANKTGMTMHFFCYVGKSEVRHKYQTLDELLTESVMLATNLNRNVFVYDTEDCYTSQNSSAVFGHEINIMGSSLNMDDDLVFDLIITKDTRVGRTTRKAHVYSTTISADALDTIDFDNLDVNAALTIISLVVGVRNNVIIHLIITHLSSLLRKDKIRKVYLE